MAKRGRSARTKGHNFEREMAQLFRELGWSDCVTSRSESKNLDDLGIDLCYTDPFQIQCKAQEKMDTAPHDLLSSMPEGLNVVIHKRNNKGTIVYLDLKNFLNLIKEYKHNDY